MAILKIQFFFDKASVSLILTILKPSVSFFYRNPVFDFTTF